MLNRAKIAFKFFVYGLAVGLLFAPRSGAETRREVVNWFTGTIKEAISNGSEPINS